MFTKPYHPGQHGDPSYSVKANKKTKKYVVLTTPLWQQASPKA